MRALLTALLRTVLLLPGCGSQAVPGPQPGPDCQVLARAAARAADCDAALEPLAREMLESPEELECQVAVRQLLNPAPGDSRVRSVHTSAVTGPSGPLTPQEVQSVAELPLPATLTMSPDLRPGPGLPTTRATLDNAAVQPDSRGNLRSTVSPGPHTITIQHAGRETTHCVTLDACETVALTLHAAHPASHPRLRPGPCE